MARCSAVELTKTFAIVHAKLGAAHMEPDVEKHTPVAGRENEIVPSNPARLFRIMPEQITINDRAHFGAAKWQTEVTRLRCLHRIHRQAACLIRGACESLDI